MFNAKEEVTKIVEFIRSYYKKNNLKGAVLGISGGKDSAVVAALFAKALGSENVLGVTLPCHSKEIDAIDAKLVSDKYGFDLINIDLTPVYDSFINEINKLGNYNENELNNSNINLKPRLRMASVYYLAALYSKLKGGTYIVAGTSNLCELYVGYFTKGGDSSYDIGVLNNYTVEEVIKIGEYLEVPEKVLYKTPHDGLSKSSDEEKLGVKYSEIAEVINNPENPNVSKEAYQRIMKLHNNNQHKFNPAKYIRK